MAEQFFTDIEIDVGDDVIQKINDKLSSHTFEISAELSSDSINNIEDSLDNISIGADLDLSDIETEIENISGAIGGTIEGMADGLDEINDKLLDMASGIESASSSQERQARAQNLDMSNELTNRILATGATMVGAGAGLGAIRQAGDTAISLQQVHERTEVDYDVLGRFVSGLTTGRELLDPKVALNMGETIANKITDLFTGKSPEGVEALRILGLDTSATREDVLEKIMGLSDKDFDKFTPEINRTFEQVLGINFNALKGANFSENLFTDEQTALSIRESKRDLNEELTELKQNFSGFNIWINGFLTFITEKVNSALGDDFSGFVTGMYDELFSKEGKQGREQSLKRYRASQAVERIESSNISSALSDDFRLTHGNTPYFMSKANTEIGALTKLIDETPAFKNAINTEKLKELTGEDLKLQRTEMTNETLKEVVIEIKNLYREMAKTKITVVNQGGDIQSNILKDN